MTYRLSVYLPDAFRPIIQSSATPPSTLVLAALVQYLNLDPLTATPKHASESPAPTKPTIPTPTKPAFSFPLTDSTGFPVSPANLARAAAHDWDKEPYMEILGGAYDRNAVYYENAEEGDEPN